MTQNVDADPVGSDTQPPPWWAGRPRRSRGDRRVAGVASGLGRAFGVDPVLIRVAFVVLAIFGGFGVLLYALGWLLLPADGDQVSAAEALVGRGHSSVSPALAVLLVVVTVGSAGSIFSWGLSFWPVAVGAVIVAVVAHKRRWGGQGGCGPGREAPIDWNQRGQQFADRAAQWGSRAPWMSRPRASRPWGSRPWGLRPWNSRPWDSRPWDSGWAGGNAGSAPGTDAGSPFDRPAFWDNESADTSASGWAPPAPGSRVGGTPPTGTTAATAPSPPVTQPPADGTPARSAESTDVAPESPSPTDLLAGGRRTPPAWDPLGVAPFAWDLPDPPPPAVEPQMVRRGPMLARVVLGLALVTGAILAAGAASGQWALSWAQVSGATLAVVAIGLLIGALRGTGRRLIGPGVFLSFLTLALTVTGISGTSGYGQQTWAPTVADVAAGQLTYTLNAGDGVLDLRQLAVAGGQTVLAELEVKAGQATVIVPKSVTVDATCSARVGEVDCLGKTGDGIRPTVTANQLGSMEAGTVTVRVHTNVGSVEVRNG